MTDALHLLLVVPSEGDALSIARTLERAGSKARIERIPSLEALEAALTGSRWDALVCDPRVLPAAEVLARVKACVPPLPCVMLTDTPTIFPPLALIQAGARDCLRPSELARLAPVLESARQESRARLELERVRDSLRESEARYRALFEESSVPIWELDFSGVRTFLEGVRAAGVADLDAHLAERPEAVQHCARLVRVVDLNRESMRLFAIDHDSAASVGLAGLLGDESMPAFRELLAVLAAGGTHFESEIALRTPSGERLQLMLRLAVVSGTERPLGRVHVSFVDITQRLRAEEEAQQDANRLQRIIRIAQHATSTLQELMNYSLDEVVALSESQLGYIYYYSEETRQFTLHAWSSAVMAACSITDPQTLYDLDKTGIWGEAVRQRRPIVVNDFRAPHPLKRGYPEGHAPLSRFMTVPVFSDGHIVAVAGVANKLADYTERDVRQLTLMMDSVWMLAERRRAEESVRALERRVSEAQRLESIGLLAGGIAHDFNNLLTVIMGQASLALRQAPSGVPADGALREIHAASERAAELCQQLLAYAGKSTGVPEPLDLSATVVALQPVLMAATPRHVSLRWELAAGLPRVRADRDQIRQVIAQLVTNAAEAIGERDGTIHVRTGLGVCALRDPARVVGGAPADVPCVWVEVQDDGCGMDEETRGKVFDPFFSTKFTGRGLGLPAAQGIARAHRGDVDITSAPDEGTTVRVSLPVAPEAGSAARGETAIPARDAETPLAAEAGGPSPPAGPPTVLLVDDEPLVRGAVEAMLRHLGYEVISAIDGLDGVRLYRENAAAIQCVLLDLTMPHLDGVAALREMRAIRSEVRALVASGYGEEEVMRRFASESVVGFLPKPYTLDTLGERLREVLAARV